MLDQPEIEIPIESFSSGAKHAPDLTALTNTFEFWPAWTIHLPMVLLGIYQGFRLGNLNFFPAVNPGMTNGGLFNYSKYDSLSNFSKENIPAGILSNPPHHLDQLLTQAHEKRIGFPFILKPDIGERGRGVSLISNQQAAENYLKTFRNEAVILQEFVSKKEEYGIFILKNPKTGEIKIPSITQKIPLQVLGNGLDSVEKLVQKHPRAKRYIQEIPKDLMSFVPEPNRIFQLSIKGNHCKGAVFVDRSELITPEVISSFAKICQPFQHFFYGRLDIKVNSSAELVDPHLVSILEVNGANAEPIHIYSPGISYFRSLGILSNFFSHMAQIARFNLNSIHPKPSLSALKSSFQSYLHLKKSTHE
ncbi:MAG: ATP-grasp domain-containing protein [Flavobacteriales bacterium]|nr:ATP-grasp domain-containing protein [Flavobacteriales bacterium]